MGMDEQRAALRHALLYRAMALSADDDRDTYALAHARRDANRGRPGAALAAIRARLKVAKLDGTCNRALHDAKAQLLETLEPEDWVRLAKEDLLRRYPPTTNPL